jgi:hypothetical protein
MTLILHITTFAVEDTDLIRRHMRIIYKLIFSLDATQLSRKYLCQKQRQSAIYYISNTKVPQHTIKCPEMRHSKA